MVESPASVLQVTAAGLCSFSRQSQWASGLQAPGMGNLSVVICLRSQEGPNPPMTNILLREMSQNIYHGSI